MPPRGFKRAPPTFRCTLCPYTTNRQNYLEDHNRTHTGERPYECDECGKAFSQKSNLGQHMKTHNKGPIRFHRCNICDFTTKWKSSLLIHQRWHSGEKPYKCSLCDKRFSQSTHCRTHIREFHSEARNYQCDRCNKGFKRQEHLDRHLVFHSAIKNFKCEICGKKFSEKSGLRQHERIHLGDAGKTNKCSQCPYKSFFKQCLKVHMRIHTGEKPFFCSHCSKKFRTSSSLKLHNRMIHQGIAGKIFRCENCTFITANKQHLKNHNNRIHLGIKEKFSLQCPYCQKMFYSRSQFYTHRKHKHFDSWHSDLVISRKKLSVNKPSSKNSKKITAPSKAATNIKIISIVEVLQARLNEANKKKQNQTENQVASSDQSVILGSIKVENVDEVPSPRSSPRTKAKVNKSPVRKTGTSSSWKMKVKMNAKTPRIMPDISNNLEPVVVLENIDTSTVLPYRRNAQRSAKTRHSLIPFTSTAAAAPPSRNTHKRIHLFNQNESDAEIGKAQDNLDNVLENDSDQNADAKSYNLSEFLMPDQVAIKQEKPDEIESSFSADSTQESQTDEQEPPNSVDTKPPPGEYSSLKDLAAFYLKH